MIDEDVDDYITNNEDDEDNENDDDWSPELYSYSAKDHRRLSLVKMMSKEKVNSGLKMTISKLVSHQ